MCVQVSCHTVVLPQPLAACSQVRNCYLIRWRCFPVRAVTSSPRSFYDTNTLNVTLSNTICSVTCHRTIVYPLDNKSYALVMRLGQNVDLSIAPGGFPAFACFIFFFKILANGPTCSKGRLAISPSISWLKKLAEPLRPGMGANEAQMRPAPPPQTLRRAH